MDASKPDWKFPWDVRVPFPRTSPYKLKGLEVVEIANGTRGYSGWEFWTTSEDVPFISEIFRSGKPK